jgi:N6-adenosine-specific RNA methylase IME4
MSTLVKLEGAVKALAEARTLEEVKHVHDIATAAAEYARAARLGLEAQNHAAEIKLRAERKAGELLAGLERGVNRFDLGSRPTLDGYTEYQSVLEETSTPRQAAHRWQKIAALPDDTFEQFIAETVERRAELTTTGALRIAKELEREAKRQENAQHVATVITTDAIPAEFTTIVIDPPWDWGDEGDFDQLGRARPTYATMSLSQLAALYIPAANNSHIYLWITNRSLPKGFTLLDAWGFRYVTCLTWVKPHYGMGNYFRGQTEHLLFGVRGSLSLMRRDAGTVIHAPRGDSDHSSKPVEAYDLIETCSPGPYLDMFSRQTRRGWFTWGEAGYASF